MRLFLKNFQFSTRRTRILMRINISTIHLAVRIVNAIGRILVRCKVLQTILRFCATLSAISCTGLSLLEYGVATVSRLLKIIVLFCRISFLFYGSFAKETYNFKEPTTRSHLIIEATCIHQECKSYSKIQEVYKNIRDTREYEKLKNDTSQCRDGCAGKSRYIVHLLRVCLMCLHLYVYICMYIYIIHSLSLSCSLSLSVTHTHTHAHTYLRVEFTPL